ncbi:condensation protein [Streptomyces flavofungini]|uniref:condensation protein n=1 Tax=Streptomyces flavofungini TaxID=68200 RepID=UPI0025B031F9|nr:condensation protein [Streptomyces flavofungini]WJV49000.1 condensation protein [Streptomyces flavofungini]
MTALEHPARRADGPGRPPRRVPFPVVDEVARHCLQEEEPETVHIEVHLPGTPDADRLKAAFGEALRRHPRILVREARGPWYRRRYEWELTEGPDVEVVTFPAPVPDALKRARERALCDAPPLTASPPIRLEVVTDADGDSSVLFLTINHTALDGPACLRVLATAAELYGGRDNAPAAPPTRTPVSADASGAPAHGPSGLPSPWAAPARVARGAPERAPAARPGVPGTGLSGNGMLVAELPVPRRPKGAPYTVNDQLMVTTALMIAHWNHEHGSKPRPLRITMPVDDRPRDMTMPIGNGTRLVEVPFGAGELLPEGSAGRSGPDGLGPEEIHALLRRTSDRTRALKALLRPQLGHGAALLTAPVLPVTMRAAVTRGLRRAAGPWTSTTLLSNIGRVPYALDFGDAGAATAVWFSAPARMPRGLTVTTASTAGRLHLALRWSRTLLSPGDGAHLRDLFEHYLRATQDLHPTPEDDGS